VISTRCKVLAVLGAVGLAGCNPNGLQLTVDISSAAYGRADEVRVRLGVESQGVPELPMSVDLGGADLSSSRQGGVLITPAAGSTEISFARGSFPLAQHFETLLQPVPMQVATVGVAGGLFQSGKWLGGGPALVHVRFSSSNSYSAHLSLDCDDPVGCNAESLVDLAAPPAAPKVAVTRATAHPLSLLAVAPLTVPGAATAIFGDSLNVMLYPPLVGQPFPDTLAPATTIIGKFGEPLSGALVADLDGDGQADLILSSSMARGGAGLIFILYAPKLPSGATFDLNVPANYAQTARIVGQRQEGLGSTLAAVPPPVGSATTPILLAAGAPHYNLNYVFAPPVSGEVSSSTAQATLSGGTTVGGALVGGVLDQSLLVIGAPMENTVYLLPASSLTGLINVKNAMRISGPKGFGAALAIGPAELGTLAVGAPDADTVEYFSPGSSRQWTLAPEKTFTGPAGSGFGSAVAVASVANNPLWIAVGAPQASPFGRLRGGEVIVFKLDRLRPGPTNGVGDSVQLVWPEADGDGLGVQLGFGSFDTSSTSQQLFVGKSTAPGAVYGIQSLPNP
jgi:hypothetical protein